MMIKQQSDIWKWWGKLKAWCCSTVELAKKLSPNIVLMDISMPDLNGIDATHQITTPARRRLPAWLR